MVKPGAQTSEFKIASVLLVLGAALDAAAVVLHVIQGTGLDAPWLSIALLVTGTGLSVMSTWGYTRSRTLVKLAELQPQASAVIGQAMPLAKEIVRILRDQRALEAPTPNIGPPR